MEILVVFHFGRCGLDIICNVCWSNSFENFFQPSFFPGRVFVWWLRNGNYWIRLHPRGTYSLSLNGIWFSSWGGCAFTFIIWGVDYVWSATCSGSTIGVGWSDLCCCYIIMFFLASVSFGRTPPLKNICKFSECLYIFCDYWHK